MTTRTEGRGVAPADGRQRPAAPRTGGWRAVTEHWLAQYRRVWFGSAVSSFLTPLLYLAGMGFGLGALVDGASGGIGGTPYVQFVAPGVLAAAAMQVAAGETTFPVIGAIKWQRFYEGMLATPLGVRDVVRGHLAFVLVRLVTACSVFLLVAALLGLVRSPWGVLALPVSVLGGMACAAGCFAYSARLVSDQGVVLLFRFVIMPVQLFAGTFFPVEQLPGWLQPVAWVTPLWHAVEACRALVLGTVTPGPLLGHLAYLALWVVVGALVSERVLRRRMVV